MFADRQLAELAERKLRVQARITVRRMEGVVAATELARPVALADRAWELWNQYSPLIKAVGIPLALLVLRKVFRRPSRVPLGGKSKGWIATLLGALPIILQLLQALRPKLETAGKKNL